MEFYNNKSKQNKHWVSERKFNPYTRPKLDKKRWIIEKKISEQAYKELFYWNKIPLNKRKIIISGFYYSYDLGNDDVDSKTFEINEYFLTYVDNYIKNNLGEHEYADMIRIHNINKILK